MNAGTANVIPVKLFPLDPFFNVFNRWQLPLQFFRQAAGYFIRTDAHVLVNDPTAGYGIFIENMLEAAG